MDTKLADYLKFKINDETHLSKKDDYYKGRVDAMKHILEMIYEQK